MEQIMCKNANVSKNEKRREMTKTGKKIINGLSKIVENHDAVLTG